LIPSSAAASICTATSNSTLSTVVGTPNVLGQKLVEQHATAAAAAASAPATKNSQHSRVPKHVKQELTQACANAVASAAVSVASSVSSEVPGALADAAIASCASLQSPNANSVPACNGASNAGASSAVVSASSVAPVAVHNSVCSIQGDAQARPPPPTEPVLT
jgi:hypothetical protein